MAGRKPIDDKAIPVTVYIKQSRVTELGGIENVRSIVTQILTTAKDIKYE